MRLLDGVNLSFEAGRMTVLIGPNGAGKTTLLRVASGELAPDQGVVRLDDRAIDQIELEDRARRIAFLTQQTVLDFPFTGQEVMEMGRIPHMTGRKHDREVVGAVVRECGLDDLVHRTYTTLSGGEKQRIQLGRILCQIWDAQSSGVVLLDEPTSALDLSHQLAFFDVIGQIRSRGAAIILVIHDINLAARFADRIVLMSGGTITADGSPREVLGSEAMAAAFEVVIDLIDTGDVDRPMIRFTTPGRS
ncbi:MAG: heme ABC transporter ATP-binding protein [Proteobacteria bacterium]|nr:heme ABC transporter ATP-binding protein [Pseudomonadota bacterium]